MINLKDVQIIYNNNELGKSIPINSKNDIIKNVISNDNDNDNHSNNTLIEHLCNRLI